METFVFCTVYDGSMAFSPELLSCLFVQFIKCYPLPCLTHTKRYDFVFASVVAPTGTCQPSQYLELVSKIVSKSSFSLKFCPNFVKH